MIQLDEKKERGLTIRNTDGHVISKRATVFFTLYVIGLLILTSSVTAQGEKVNDATDNNDEELIGLALCCGGISMFIILPIVMGIWVYKDSERRGMNSAVWLLIILVSNLVGLIIYLYIRREHPIGSFAYGKLPQGFYPPGGYPPPYPPQYPPTQIMSPQGQPHGKAGSKEIAYNRYLSNHYKKFYERKEL